MKVGNSELYSFEDGTYTFGDMYPFLDVYQGDLNIYDIDTGDLLYRSTTDGNIPSEYGDCEVSDCQIDDNAVVFYITYSFHEIEE